MRILRAPAVGLALALALLTPTPAARAQQAIAEVAGIRYVIFCEHDIETLDSAAHLTPIQRESAEALMRSALAEARQTYGVYRRRDEALGQTYAQTLLRNPDSVAEARKAYFSDSRRAEHENAREIAAIERKALNDLRSILTTDQLTAAWPVFERTRRRLMLAAPANLAGVGPDPAKLVRSARLSPDDQAAADKRLAEYDLAIDPLLVKIIDSLVRANRDRTDFDPRVEVPPDPLEPKLNKLNVQTLQAIERDVSDEGRIAFRQARVGAELSGQFTRPSADDAVKRITSLASLADDQKAAIDRLVKEADALALGDTVQELHRRDEAALREQIDGEEERKLVTLRYRTARARVYTLTEHLLSLLSAPQKEEVDLAALAAFDKLAHVAADPFKSTREPPPEDEANDWTPKPPPSAPTHAPAHRR